MRRLPNIRNAAILAFKFEKIASVLSVVARRWRQVAASTLLAGALLPAFAANQDKMVDRLDRLDRAEMLDLLARSEGCVRVNDFSCAELSLSKAKKLAKGGQNLSDWSRGNQVLTDARVKVEQERQARLRAEQEAAEEARRIAQEKRRIAQEEEEREQDRRNKAAWAARAQERDEREADNNAQIAGAFNAVIQNFNNLNAAQRAQQLIALRRASDARAREVQADAERSRQNQADAERNRQRADSQRLAEERSRQDGQRTARERQQQDASVEKSRQERLAAQTNAARERDRERDQLAAETQRRQEREQQATQARQRKEREQAERLAQQEADKAAARKEMMDFHAAMTNGIRLAATKCPDGAGHYYATGTVPRVKEPQGGACIDVNYEASCPGQQAIRGTAKNFIGMSGCFGDTYQIDPKPGCDVKSVRVRVASVQTCP